MKRRHYLYCSACLIFMDSCGCEQNHNHQNQTVHPSCERWVQKIEEYKPALDS